VSHEASLERELLPFNSHQLLCCAVSPVSVMIKQLGAGCDSVTRSGIMSEENKHQQLLTRRHLQKEVKKPGGGGSSLTYNCTATAFPFAPCWLRLCCHGNPGDACVVICRLPLHSPTTAIMHEFSLRRAAGGAA